MSLVHAYYLAKARVSEAGYRWEIQWQSDRDIKAFSESDFLREAAWVILSAGMRETVIRSKFEAISTAFRDWRSAKSIWLGRKKCAIAAMETFRHKAKINAIVEVAKYVALEGFHCVVSALQSEGIEFLQNFSYLGPATSLHLAKNLGMCVAKPDRHLLRVATAAGFSTPADLCDSISIATGDSVAVVDVVIWRYATLESNYVDHFHQQVGWAPAGTAG